MQLEIDCVKNFHDAKGISPQQSFPAERVDLSDVAEALAEIAKSLEERYDGSDQRHLRAHLIIEEASELVAAFAGGNELLALDAITDLLYVVLGTAVVYDWPLVEAFAEVHMSNMSKTVNTGGNDRLRSKGDQYKPPQLMDVLRRYRDGGSGLARLRGRVLARRTISEPSSGEST